MTKALAARKAASKALRKDFPIVDAFKHHGGRTKKNRIDSGAVAKHGIELFGHMAKGAINCVELRHEQILIAGRKRRVRITLDMELA